MHRMEFVSSTPTPPVVDESRISNIGVLERFGRKTQCSSGRIPARSQYSLRWRAVIGSIFPARVVKSYKCEYSTTSCTRTEDGPWKYSRNKLVAIVWFYWNLRVIRTLTAVIAVAEVKQK